MACKGVLDLPHKFQLYLIICVWKCVLKFFQKLQLKQPMKGSLKKPQFPRARKKLQPQNLKLQPPQNLNLKKRNLKFQPLNRKLRNQLKRWPFCWIMDRLDSDSDSIIYLVSIYRTHTASILKRRWNKHSFTEAQHCQYNLIKVIMIIVFNYSTTFKLQLTTDGAASFMKFTQRAIIASFEILILRYSALLEFHRVLNKGNSIRDKRWWHICTRLRFILCTEHKGILWISGACVIDGCLLNIKSKPTPELHYLQKNCLDEEDDVKKSTSKHSSLRDVSSPHLNGRKSKFET